MTAVQIQILLCDAYLVWAQQADYSHTVFQHTAHIVSAQEFAYSHAVFHDTAHIVSAHEAAYSYAVCHHTVRNGLAQEAAYNITVYHHTADTVWAQEVDYSHTVFHHTARIVSAQEFVTAMQVFSIVFTSSECRVLLTATQFLLYWTQRVGAGGCLRHYGLSPYCRRRVVGQSPSHPISATIGQHPPSLRSVAHHHSLLNGWP